MIYYQIVHPRNLTGNIHVTRTTASGKKRAVQLIPGQLLRLANVRQLDTRIKNLYTRAIQVKSATEDTIVVFGIRFLSSTVGLDRYTVIPEQGDLFHESEV